MLTLFYISQYKITLDVSFPKYRQKHTKTSNVEGQFLEVRLHVHDRNLKNRKHRRFNKQCSKQKNTQIHIKLQIKALANPTGPPKG